MKTFKIGDRVMAVKDSDAMESKWIGKVEAINQNGTQIKVKFDAYYLATPDEIELIDEPESKPNTSTFKPEPNTITLQTSDTSEPILVLKPNGDIYVNGRLTTNDMEVVEGLRRFLLQAEFNYFK
jgi:hypothetical protein